MEVAMRVFSLIIAVISILPLLFLWLRSLRELTAASTAYRDWSAPLGLALVMTALILFVFRLAHRQGTNHRRRH